MNCQRCGLPFTTPAWPALSSPVCRCRAFGHTSFAPEPADKPPGCQPLPFLTEADVRRIVRDELAKIATKDTP